MSAGGWIWYELLTSDVEGARKFYGEVIGWKWTPHAAVPAYSLFGLGDAQLGGMMAMPWEASVHKPAWLGYVHVEDVVGTVAAAQRDGAKVTVPPTEIPGVGHFLHVRRSTGRTDLCDEAHAAGALSESFAAKVGHCQWNELVTSDPVAAAAFYVKHMGWEKGDVMSMGPMGDYQFLIGGGTRFGAVMKRAAGDPLWRYYFGVDDIDRATRAIASHGGQLRGEPQPLPGGGFAAAALDPQGAEFGVAGPRKS